MITTDHSWAAFDSLLAPFAGSPSCYDSSAVASPLRSTVQLFFFGGNGYSEACK